jgi:hypothetical protein
MELGWLLTGVGLTALAFAVLVGGREERIFVAAQAASGLAEHSFVRFEHDVPRAVLVDLAVLAIVLPLALRSNKAWPLFAASLCVASLMTEAAQMLVHAAPAAYAIIQGAWDLIADMVVAFGAWSVWRAQQRQAPLAAANTKTPGPD